MATGLLSSPGKYALATGPAAVRRLHVLHNIYSPAGRRVLVNAGLKEGMKVADFGCGVGVVTRMLAQMVGPSGSVTGVDVNGDQLRKRVNCAQSQGCRTPLFLKRALATHACLASLSISFTVAFCLPARSDLMSDRDARRPETRRNSGSRRRRFGDGRQHSGKFLRQICDLFMQLGPIRGVDYSIASNSYHLVRSVGFADSDLEIYQPAAAGGDAGKLLMWSVAEAGPSFVDAGLTTYELLEQALYEMQESLDDPDVLVLAPRMSLVWARKGQC